MTETFSEQALALATAAHAGQLYGTGEPYIIHPTQLAAMATRLGYPDEVIAACYLHDVVEDTAVTEENLREQFPAVIVDAVIAVTFFGKGFTQKIAQAMANPLGHVVKFCDVSCNFSNTVLFGAKQGRESAEVIPRLASGLATLVATLPSPADIIKYLSIVS